MKGEIYDVTESNSGKVYRFVSEGSNGAIPKLVIYSETKTANLYNLGFGDFDAKTGDFDDFARTNNGDSEKVLRTVVGTMLPFTDRFPNAVVIAKGSTSSRTRLYQMGISKYLDELEVYFVIYGILNENLEHFRRDVKYEGFMAMRKPRPP